MAEEWFRRFEGAGLDGVMVKPLALPYLEDKREMLKVKHERTADCVVAGFRWFKGGGGVGSFLLGLHDEHGALHHVGICSGFTAALRKQFEAELGPLRDGALEAHPGRSGRRWPARASSGCRAPRAGGTPRRTSRGSRSVSSGWWRSATTTCRARASGTRPTSSAGGPTGRRQSCTYAQLEAVVPAELKALFGT